MLLQPRTPTDPTVTEAGSSPVIHPSGSVCACQHSPTSTTPAARRWSLPSVSAGAVGLVLVGGVVLTALLTAVAVSAVSVAVAAVVLRSLLRQHRQQ